MRVRLFAVRFRFTAYWWLQFSHCCQKICGKSDCDATKTQWKTKAGII